MTKTILPPHRYPCGKKRKVTTAQRQNDANAAAQEAATALVRQQPHRRPFGDKSDSPLAASPMGRFCLTHKLRPEFYDAAEDWARVHRKWLNAQPGAPRLPGDGGDGSDIPYDLVHEWGSDWASGNRMMIECGGSDGAMSVWRMAIYWEEMAPGASVRSCILSLAGLACQRGKIDRKVLDRILA